MQPDEPETIVGEGAGLGGEWWILGAQWEGPELHTIVHIFDTNERPRWGSTSSNRLLRQELIDDQERVAAQSGEFLLDAPAVVGFGEAGDPFGGGGEQHPVTGLACPHRQPNGEVGLAGAGSEGDRLQQLRAVLPCDVRVVAETHPLFGRLLAARSFKRWSGVLMLVVELPDGSPGSIRADATDVFGGSVAEGAVAVLVLDAAGLRELHRLTLDIPPNRGGMHYEE